MDIECIQIALSVVTVKLDCKTITNAILDQIPRLDFCCLLVDQEGNYGKPKEIIPVCRFSLDHYLNSQLRIYKTNRYPSGAIERLIKSFSTQDEAYFFTYQGQLFCSSYSRTAGTLEYDDRYNKLGTKIHDVASKMSAARKIIDLHSQGLTPTKIVAQCYSYSTPLPRRNRPQRTKNILEDWDNDILGFDASAEEEVAHELDLITKNHGGWGQYVDHLKLAEIDDIKIKQQYECDLNDYSSSADKITKEIMASPYAILGL